MDNLEIKPSYVEEEKTGYVIATCEEDNMKYIKHITHIEKDDSCDLFEDDCEAQMQAKEDGVKLLSGYLSIPDNVYLDTPENREGLQKYFSENPVYIILDKYLLSYKLQSCIGRLSDSKELAEKLEINESILNSILKGDLEYVDSGVVNNIINSGLFEDPKVILDCLDSEIENFIE